MALRSVVHPFCAVAGGRCAATPGAEAAASSTIALGLCATSLGVRAMIHATDRRWMCATNRWARGGLGSPAHRPMRRPQTGLGGRACRGIFLALIITLRTRGRSARGDPRSQSEHKAHRAAVVLQRACDRHHRGGAWSNARGAPHEERRCPGAASAKLFRSWTRLDATRMEETLCRLVGHVHRAP